MIKSLVADPVTGVVEELKRVPALTLVDFDIGQTLQILSKSEVWRACTVVDIDDENEEPAILIHYEGYSNEHDEWLQISDDKDRIRLSDAESTDRDFTEDVSQDPSVYRGRVFHLCVNTMATLISKVNHGPCNPQHGKAFPSDEAAFEAAKTLQACWEYVWDVCDVCELRMSSSEKQEKANEEEGVALACDAFADFFASAVGYRTGSPEAEDYSCIAYAVDALVRFKQCLETLCQGSTKEPHLRRQRSGMLAEAEADDGHSLTHSISIAQKRTSESLYDPLTKQTQGDLLGKMDIIEVCREQCAHV